MVRCNIVKLSDNSTAAPNSRAFLTRCRLWESFAGASHSRWRRGAASAMPPPSASPARRSPRAGIRSEFTAVSYALPPLGELRWREPQPVAAWSGIRDAAAFSVACTQISEGWNLRYVQSSAEDCLYLNVAAPVWPPAVKFPVMVWIHGGSNTAGSGEAAGFDQRTLVRRGLVLVTINYRLGALGCLAHAALARESAHHTSGNYGLMDQIAALEWVRRNIATFGGDPYKVTVAGQSAGAMDVSLLRSEEH